MGWLSKAVKGLETNIRRNVTNVVGGLGAMASGDFRNAPRTLLDIAAVSTGGLYNPDDMTKVTKGLGMNEQSSRTIEEQAVFDAEKATKEIAAEQVRLKDEETKRQIGATLTAQSSLLGGARRRSLLAGTKMGGLI